MATFVEAEKARQKISDEINWLTYNFGKAPEGVKSEIQPLIDKRQALMSQIAAEVLKVDIPIPAEAAKYMPRTDTAK